MADPDPVEPGIGALARLSAELAVGSEAAWVGALEEARSHCADREVEEALLQAYLFVGFPIVLNALSLWRERVPRAAGTEGDGSLRERRSAGEELCRVVYGPAYERLRDNIAALHPDLDRWMIEEGYGKTLSRPGLGVEARELCVVALLAAAGHRPQLRSHVRGALNAGASAPAVQEALGIGLETGRSSGRLEAARERAIRADWEEVRSRASRRDG